MTGAGVGTLTSARAMESANNPNEMRERGARDVHWGDGERWLGGCWLRRVADSILSTGTEQSGGGGGGGSRDNNRTGEVVKDLAKNRSAIHFKIFKDAVAGR